MWGASKLEKRVKELEESLERIERATKGLQIEWAETYDKFRQLNWRVAKRVKQLENAPEDGASQPTVSQDGDAPASEGNLSASQSQINQRILARRNRMAVVPRSGGG